MEPAEDRRADDVAAVFDATSERAVPVERGVWPLVVVCDELKQHAEEVPLSQGNEVIGAFATDRADDSLGVGVLLRLLAPDSDRRGSECLDLPFEGVATNTVAVVDQVTRGSVIGERLDDLLCRPLSGRVRGHVDVDDAASVMGQDDETEQPLERQRRHDEEVASGADIHVPLDERAPGVRRLRSSDHVLLDRGLPDDVPRQRQLLLDVRGAPQRAWRRHYNEIRPHSSLGYRPPAPEARASSGCASLRQTMPVSESDRALT